jgi:threonine/homoserine/homoserine lactone efflux protein
VVVIALTPGPDMTVFLGRALAEGRTAGLVALAGAWTGSIRCWWASCLGADRGGRRAFWP